MSILKLKQKEDINARDEIYEALNDILIQAHQKYGDYTEARDALNMVAIALSEIYQEEKI